MGWVGCDCFGVPLGCDLFLLPNVRGRGRVGVGGSVHPEIIVFIHPYTFVEIVIVRIFII